MFYMIRDYRIRLSNIMNENEIAEECSVVDYYFMYYFDYFSLTHG